VAALELGQIIANGVVSGVTYMVIALGVTIIFSIMKIVQFAHGQVYMLGGFAIYLLFEQACIPYIPALLLTMLIVGLLGIPMEWILFRPLRGQESASLIVSLGLALFLEGSALLTFGGLDKGVHSPFPDGVIRFLGIAIPEERLIISLVCVVLISGTIFVIKQLKIGQAMRAVAQDSEAAMLQGVNVDRICSLGFALGSALAGAAGGLLVPVLWINPFVGQPVVIKAFVVMILGGLGSIPGCIVGGLALGFIESFGYTLLGGITGLVSFAAVILLLVFKPKGIMGND
jgi:branched-chain amino acid transport system permease protein